MVIFEESLLKDRTKSSICKPWIKFDVVANSSAGFGYGRKPVYIGIDKYYHVTPAQYVSGFDFLEILADDKLLIKNEPSEIYEYTTSYWEEAISIFRQEFNNSELDIIGLMRLSKIDISKINNIRTDNILNIIKQSCPLLNDEKMIYIQYGDISNAREVIFMFISYTDEDYMYLMLQDHLYHSIGIINV